MEKELKTIDEKIVIAKAIKEKVSARVFKKIDKKKNSYLSNLIGKI